MEENNRVEYIIKFLDREINGVPFQLNDILTFNNQKINERTEIKEIKQLIDGFIAGKKTNRYMVLPGLCGVGKTTLLYQIYDYLLNTKNISPTQILFFSCENLMNMVSTDLNETINLYLEKYHNADLRTLNKDIFLLIDESQHDKNWSITGKTFFDTTKNIFMIFTGSSALNFEYNADSARRIVKKTISALNYTQHLKLNYDLSFTDLSDSLKELLFEGNVEKAIEYESKTNNELINFIKYTPNDWEEYVKYGGFPILFEEDDYNILSSKLVDITKRVITNDMTHFKNISDENKANANRILKFLALQKPGEASQPKLSNHLRTSAANVKNILDILEKTKLIFHCEPYGESSKRIKKSWKYYFATSSLRNVLALEYGTTMSQEEHEGTVYENLIASNLYNLSNTNFEQFNVFYDSNKEKNVDFIIQRGFDKTIPIEVGRGKKNKSQIKNAINRYNSDYGIVISTKTKKIKKANDVIFIPLKTFSFI